VRTITLEEHFTTPELLSARAQTWQNAPATMHALRAKLLDLGNGRIADMDEAGIDLQVLSPSAGDLDKLDAATGSALARDTNDRLAAAVREHPTRFAGFATLALQDPVRAAVELDHCVGRLGFKGVMIDGMVNGTFLDDPCFNPFWEAAQAQDVPVYLHPSPPPQAVHDAYFSGLENPAGFLLSTAAWGWHAETGMHCLRLIVAGVFERFPGLKVIIGHMGENLPFSLARADSVLGHGATSLRRSVAEYFHEHFYVTTSAYFTLPPFLCALQVVGADRLMFSVDYPFSRNTAGRRFLDSLPVSAQDRAKISHRNAEALLKL
jgi:predicted TIM-barrel fold metal-dependent hydrolase